MSGISHEAQLADKTKYFVFKKVSGYVNCTKRQFVILFQSESKLKKQPFQTKENSYPL